MVSNEEARVYDTAILKKAPAEGFIVKVYRGRLWCEVTIRYWRDGLCSALMRWWHGIV